MTNLLDKYIAITDIKDDLDIKVANKIKHIYKLWYNIDISKKDVDYDSMFLVVGGENFHMSWRIDCGEYDSCRMPTKWFYLSDAEILELKKEDECIEYRNKLKFLKKRREIEEAGNKRREEEEYQRYLKLKEKYESNKV